MKTLKSFFESQGWNIRVIVFMRRAKVVVKVRPNQLPLVQAWFTTTLVEGMEIEFRPFTVWDRLRLWRQTARIDLCGLKPLPVTGNPPIVGGGKLLRLPGRQTEHLNDTRHEAV